MKVVVTGGAGFIGSHVVEKLIDHGYEVAIVDNLSSGKSYHLHPRASFFRIDLGSAELFDVFASERPDFVVHLAAQINVGQSIVNPVKDANVNIGGTINLLQCVKKYPVKKVIYSSSAAVYGEPQYLPVDERHPIAPASFYGLSKHVAEIYLRLFSSMFGIDYVILRYANVYGPRQDPMGEAGVISIFTSQLLSGRNPVIYGDGKQTRDFVYVEDVAMANVRALEEGHLDIFNISCNKQTSILDLVDVMRNITKHETPAVFRDMRKGDIFHSSLDNQKASQVLGWGPKTTLQTGLEKTIQSQVVFSS